ncbi:MAG TPA: lysylphosphatidylglycerol synthase transmembrane domain-containing protein [Longilinea sp.]|nr:lysylphosphatidylglycerol synthase transmembrane domain-containing protein [Longilinea sp.]
MSSRSGRFWKQFSRWAPGIIISALAIYAVTRISDWDQLMAAFQRVHPIDIAVYFIIFIISMIPRALAWWLALESKPKPIQVFFAVNEGYLFNNLFPLRIGEFARAFLLSGVTGMSPVRIFSSIFIERAYDLALAAGLLLGTIPIAFGIAWAKPVAIVVLVGVVGGLTVLYLMARNHAKVIKWMTGWMTGKKFLEQKVLPQMDALLTGWSVLTKPVLFVLSFLLMVLSWALSLVCDYYIMRVFIGSVEWWWPLFVVGILALGVALPAVPSAVGVYEGSIVAAMAVLGVDSSVALAYGVFVHFMHFCINNVLGLAGLVKDGQSIRSIFDRIKNSTDGVDPNKGASEHAA